MNTHMLMLASDVRCRLLMDSGSLASLCHWVVRDVEVYADVLPAGVGIGAESLLLAIDAALNESDDRVVSARITRETHGAQCPRLVH